MSKDFVGMSSCLFCGEPKGIVLDRKLRKKFERQMIFDNEPCPKCEEQFSKSFVIFETKPSDGSLPERFEVTAQQGNKVYLTGAALGISFDSPFAIKYANEKNKILVDEKIYALLQSQGGNK